MKKKKCEKYWKIFKENYLFFLGLDFACCIIFYFLFMFSFKKIQEYTLQLWEIAPKLEEINSQLVEGVQNVDITLIEPYLDAITSAYQGIIITSVIFLILTFLLWSIFQSLQWRIVYLASKKKLAYKNLDMKHYFPKFLLFNLPFFLIISVALYFFGGWLRLLLIALVTTIPLSFSLVIVSLLLFLFFILLFYLVSVLAVFLNKESWKQALKKTFTLKPKIHAKLFLSTIAMAVLSGAVLVLYYFIVSFWRHTLAAFLSLLIIIIIYAFYRIKLTADIA